MGWVVGREGKWGEGGIDGGSVGEGVRVSGGGW